MIRLRRLTFTALLVTALSTPLLAGGPLELGQTAPLADVKLRGVDGSMVSIAEARGDAGTLVIFTCNHCPYVKAWEDRIAALGNAYLARGIGVIAVNSNDPDKNAEDGFDGMVARAKARGMKYPYVVDADSSVARAFGATRTPEVFLFDAAGKLVYHGTIDDNAQDPGEVSRHYLRDALEAVATGREVDVKQTKAFGCSIKFRS